MTGPRTRLVLALFAGRGAFRGVAQLAPLALAATWGRRGLDAYAGAVGLCAWAVFVAGSGEKAVLKLAPRVRRIGADVRRVVLWIGAVPVIAVACAAAVAVVLPAGARLVVTAAGCAALLGLLQLLVALHRLDGRPMYDAVGYAGLAVLSVAATGLGLVLGWSPQAYLLAIASATAFVVAVVGAGLWRAPVGSGPPGRYGTPARPRIRRLVARVALLLGLSDLAGSLGGAVGYLALDLTGHRAGSGVLYIAAMASGFCSAAVLYALRLRQPATSRHQRGPAAARTRAEVRGLLRAGSAVAAGTLLILLVGDLAGANPDPVVLVAALTAVEIPLFALVTYAGFRLENTDGRTPVATATAAVAGLAGVIVTAAVLTGPLGAAGAMAALIAGLGVTAATTLAAVRPSVVHTRRSTVVIR